MQTTRETSSVSPAEASRGGPREASTREVGKGLIALLAVQFFFGLFPVVLQFAFEDHAFSPSAIAFWRIAVGSIVLGALVFARLGAEAIPKRGEWSLLFLLSLLSVALNQGFYLEGRQRSSGTATGLVMCLIPVFTYGVAILVRQEKPRLVRIVGIVVALAGTIPLMLEKKDAAHPDQVIGVAFLMTNALVYSVYLVLAKPLMRRHSPLFLVAWVYVLSIFALPWFARGTTLLPSIAGHERAWWAMGYTLVFPTILAYLLNAYALARVPASTTAFFIYMQPLITGGASALWLGEKLTPMSGITAIAMFVGITLVMRRER